MPMVPSLSSLDVPGLRQFELSKTSMRILLLFEEQARICSPHDDQPGAKGPGLSEGAYMLIILSISVVIVFASLLVLS